MLKERISTFWDCVQNSLFPRLEVLDIEMTDKLYALVATLELLKIEEFISRPSCHVRGVKQKSRRNLARAFVAMSFFGGNDRKSFRERLMVDVSLRKICGWSSTKDVPSESTFCRAFSEFSRSNLADKVHEATLTKYCGDEIMWHSSIDSTAIPAREKPSKKPSVLLKVKGKQGRPKKGSLPKTAAAPSRIERQINQEAEIAIMELPTKCDHGAKVNSKGKQSFWSGYKLHVGVNEYGIPLMAITTSASVHDSQVAIPLLKLIDRRVTVLYDLFDKAYDADPIRAMSESLGHRPIIDRKKRRGEKATIPMEPDRAVRFKGRTAVERFFARLKDEFGGDEVRVRGHEKVHTHLMFGLLVIFADQLLRIV